jgi:hypothetical protein
VSWRRRQLIRLEHPSGCRVDIRLPADMEVVGQAMEALGREGFSVPAAKGARTMTLTGDFGTLTIPLGGSE